MEVPHVESAVRRRVGEAWACVILLLLAATLTLLNVQAHMGVDQNGYLVGGKQIAEHLSMQLSPTEPGTQRFDPFGWVDRMWVGVDLNGEHPRFYPKYPIGLPATVAVARWIGGPDLAYWISPACTVLAAGATFLLSRRIGGSFAAVLAMATFATSSVILQLGTNPNSHALTTALVAGGAWLMLRWWHGAPAWQGFAGGLLTGAAVTVRYTEGTLILPMLVIITAVLWKDRTRWRGAVASLAGWAVPVTLLAWHNLIAMGSLTGYDPTNESTGFRLEYAADNWSTVLRVMTTDGIGPMFAVAVASLAAMTVRKPLLAAWLLAWTLPCLLIYTFYYWAPDNDGTSTARFFTTILPALAASAAWGLATLRWGLPHRPAAIALGGGLLTAMTVAMDTGQALPRMEVDYQRRLMLAETTDAALAAARGPDPAQRAADPLRDTVLVMRDDQVARQIQFESDVILYNPNTFNQRAIQRMAEAAPDEPQTLDPGRAAWMATVMGDQDQKQLNEQRDNRLRLALDHGGRVLVLEAVRGKEWIELRTDSKPPGSVRGLAGGNFEPTVIARWNTSLPVSTDEHAPRGQRIRTPRFEDGWVLVELRRKS